MFTHPPEDLKLEKTKQSLQAVHGCEVVPGTTAAAAAVAHAVCFVKCARDTTIVLIALDLADDLK